MITALQHYLRGISPWAVVILLGAGAAGPAAGADPPRVSEAEAEQRLEALHDRIRAVREDIEADRAERSEAEKRVEALDREIAGLTAELRETQSEQAAVQGEIDELDRRMAALNKRLAAHKGQVAELAYSAYVMGRQSHLKLFLSQQEPAAINRMLGYHDYIVAARAGTIEQINRWAAELRALAAEQAARRDELEGLAAEYRARQAALEERRAERQAAVAKLGARIASSQDELSRLQQDENQLRRILEELRAYSASQRLPDGAFRRMQGRLRLPVSAPIAARYGETRATGVRWDGIMFRPETGDEVNAIYAGRVVFADWLRGFGLLLIIDHGDGFMSLYGHNESLFKQIGDWVDTGEVIATVGTSGGLDRPGLYFEIRHDGEPQNPLSWCERA